MNGRLYDPVVGRMLNPDNFVQVSSSTQGYNRYSYCNNNPLKYTDPSGNKYLEFHEYTEGHHMWGGGPGGGSFHIIGTFGNGLSSGVDGFYEYLERFHAWVDGFHAYNNLTNSPIIQTLLQLPSESSWSPEYGFSYPYQIGTKSSDVRSACFFTYKKITSFWFQWHKESNTFYMPGTNIVVNPDDVINASIKISTGGGPLFEFVGFNRGIPEFESKLMPAGSAVTPGPFIIYSTGNSKKSYYNTHEPGHVVQNLLLGPVLYYQLIAIPSLISAKFFPNQHNQMPWETSANQLWYWLTGETHEDNPLLIKKK